MRRMLILATLAYGLGQGANFLFQLQLLHLLGSSNYADAGLAHLLLMTLIFLADLGYASLFLRETLDRPNWIHDWRCALAQRLIATLLLLFLASIFAHWQWQDSAALDYWLGSAPAALLALINYSAPMIVGGRRLAALIAGQIAWPIALLLSFVLPSQLPFSFATSAGLTVTAGFALQALVHALCSRQAKLWMPRLRMGQLAAASRLSMLGVCGTLHDRLTPFLLAPLAPSFMPWYLILSHALNGLSGVQAQLSRLLLPGAGQSEGRARTLKASSWSMWGTATAVVGAFFLQALHPPPEQSEWLAFSAVTVLAWGISATSGFLSLPLISRNRERPLLRLMLIGLGISSFAQLTAAWAAVPDALLWSRTLCMLAMMLGLLRLLELRMTPWGWWAISAGLLACIAGFVSLALWLTLPLALVVLAGLLGQRACYRQPSSIGTAT